MAIDTPGEQVVLTHLGTPGLPWDDETGDTLTLHSVGWLDDEAAVVDPDEPADVDNSTPCTPWTTRAAVLAWPPVAALSPQPSDAVVDNMIDVAEWLLYERSGRRWPGICTATVYIDVDACGCGNWPRCGCSWTCRRPSGPAIRVGHQPIVEVTSVTIDGTVVAPSAYHVEDHRWIVRTDGDTWTTTGAETIVVVYTHGRRPPAAGELAARVLAAELVLSASPGALCSLPRRTQTASRQQVTIGFMDPQGFFGDGLIGVYEVDLFLSTIPRPVVQRRSRVFLPGVGPMLGHRRG